MTRMRDTFFETANALLGANLQDELCCVFAQEWSRRAFGAAAVQKAPNSAWNLHVGTSQWGPAEACVQAGINAGPAVVCMPATLLPLLSHVYYRMQGWRSDGTGHTLTIEGLPEGRARIYDSAKGRNERISNVNLADFIKQFDRGLCIVALKEAA